MKNSLREIEEWTGHRQPKNGFPWIRVMLAMLIALFIAITFTGCATRFYDNGKLSASFPANMGNVHYSRTADGAVSWDATNVDPSKPIIATGKSVAGATTAAAGSIASFGLAL